MQKQISRRPSHTHVQQTEAQSNAGVIETPGRPSWYCRGTSSVGIPQEYCTVLYSTVQQIERPPPETSRCSNPTLSQGIALFVSGWFPFPPRSCPCCTEFLWHGGGLAGSSPPIDNVEKPSVIFTEATYLSRKNIPYFHFWKPTYLVHLMFPNSSVAYTYRKHSSLGLFPLGNDTPLVSSNISKYKTWNLCGPLRCPLNLVH